ncbi:MAG: hypothetical protein AVO33_06330 [delta proteobacterium ML8_F1]|nr:MAG: hypothetical protein AVO33_06330 [delta proteobacterium ML8_F1]
MKKIIMVGMGAIGTTFAAQMKDSGLSPLVLSDSARKARYTQEGFTVNGKSYDFEYILPTEKHLTADFIFVAVKYHDLPAIREDLKPFMGAHTVLVSLMNGIDSEEILGETLGREGIVHAYVMQIDAVREGQSVTYSQPGQIVYGRANGQEDEAMTALKSLFNQTIINHLPVNNILERLWFKFLINVGLNQVSAILDAPYGVFQRFDMAYELVKDAMREVIAISRAKGIPLEESVMDDFKEIMDTLDPKAMTSMHQDVRAQRKTEVEMLAGKVIDLGRKYDIPTPVNDTLFKMLKTLEYQYTLNQ